MMAPAFFVFLVVYLLSFLIVLGYNEWFMIWVGLELNMFSFVSMVYKSDSWMGVESLFSYFFIQGLSSGVFLVMLYLGMGLEYPLMMSMAAGPFFFWLPSVMMGLGWGVCFLLMTFQKLIPLVLLSGMISMSVVIWGVIGMVIGVIGSYGQQLVKELMAYSSVSHVGWMMCSQIVEEDLWMFYFVLYMLMLGMVIVYLYESDIYNLSGMKWWDVFVFFILVVSMSGVPPMLGFMMKWLVLEKFLEISVVISFIMIFSSLVMIYVYVRMIYEGVVDGGMWMSWDFMESYSMVGLSLTMVVGTFFVPFVVWYLF